MQTKINNASKRNMLHNNHRKALNMHTKLHFCLKHGQCTMLVLAPIYKRCTFNGSKAFLLGVNNAYITAIHILLNKTINTCIFSRLPPLEFVSKFNYQKVCTLKLQQGIYPTYVGWIV